MIDPTKFYSSVEAKEIIGLKSRQFISRWVEEGQLLAITTGKKIGKRYLIRGDWLEDFIKRYKQGLPEKYKYSQEKIKKILEKAIKELK